MNLFDRLLRKKSDARSRDALSTSIPGEDIPPVNTDPGKDGGEVPERSDRKRFSLTRKKARDAAQGTVAKKGFSLGRKKPEPGAGQPGKASPETGDTTPLELTYVEQGVVSIDGRSFAIGLTWVAVVETDSLKSHLEVARKLSASRKQADVDFSLVVGDKVSGFYGFGTAELGHKRGIPVLIDALDEDVLGSNWLAVQRIPGNRDLWWVGGRRGGDVFEDRVLTSKDAAAALFTENLDAPNWSTIIAPDDWRVRNSTPHFPKSALRKPVGRMRIVDPVKVYGPRIMVSMILVGVLAAGGYYFWDKQQKYNAEMEELRLQIERAITLEPQDFPWYHRTRLDVFIERCKEEMAGMLVFPAGWENEVFTCQIDRGRGTVSTGWRRSGGNIAWLRAAMPEDFPAITVNPAAQAATASRRFEAPIDPDAVRADPWERPILESRMTERFQLRDIRLNMRFVADTRPAETNPLFNRHDIQIQGSMDLGEIVPFLEDIPALIPEAISYNIATSSWSLIVRVHHPVIVPEIKP